ncbi:MAG: iron ABC transporter permease [Acidimicrobiia bacterium]|nr:iron ABC transporter permease [Acidimicrobiia bacterium]
MAGQAPAAVTAPRPGRAVLVALPLSFLGVFFLWPLVSIIWTGLAPGGAFDPAAFTEVLTDGDLLGVAWFTLWQATVSTALTLVVAMPGAYVFARYEFPGKRLLRAAATIPFVLPTMVVGTAFLALIGPHGALGFRLDGTVGAILIAHVFFNYAVVLRTVGGLWSHLDPRIEEAARTLGAGRWRTFTSVTLPLLRPAIAAAASIVFLFTFTSFGIVLILGGAGTATLEVEIYRQTSTLFDLPVAAVLAILQVVGVTAVLLAYSRYQERNALEQSLRPAVETSRRPRTAGERLLVGGVLTSMILLLGAPPAVLVQRSLDTGDGWGLGFYRALGEQGRTAAQFVEAGGAVRNSLGFALAATVIALVVGITAAVVVASGRGRSSRWFDALLMLPLGTSAVTIGFGFIVALDAPVDLRASPWLVPLAHALVAIPFVVRSLVPVMRSVRSRLREAAAVLGAAPGRVWREIDLPIVSRAAAVGAGFAMAVSLGEFGATAFVARPDTPTMPVAIFRYLGRPGEVNFGRAMAMSVVLMVVTAAAVALIERFRAPGIGDF